MPRIRTIKPELFLSETLAQVSLAAERTFTGLLTQADDKGRFRDSPAVLNGALWPCRPEHSVKDMEQDIQELVTAGLLCRYEVDKKKYLHFPTWDEHQKISHPSTRNIAPPCPTHDDEKPAKSASKIPKKALPPEGDGNSLEGSRKTPQGKERKGKEKPPSISPQETGGGYRGGRISSTRVNKSPVLSADADSCLKKGKHSKANTKNIKSSNKEEPDMGVYDTTVAPFADLRKEGTVTRGKRKVGKNGVDPKYLDDVETVIEHYSAAHKKLGTKFRITDSWYTDTQLLLRGSGAVEPFTAPQLCDLIDFGMNHNFWHAHITNPSGLKKHGPKLFGSDDFISWSLANNRPEANRPRSSLIKTSKPVVSRGQLAADKKNTAEDYQKPL